MFQLFILFTHRLGNSSYFLSAIAGISSPNRHAPYLLQKNYSITKQNSVFHREITKRTCVDKVSHLSTAVIKSDLIISRTTTLFLHFTCRNESHRNINN
ncbi:hypothetical protein PUN28_014621 [Cardiocondyla obscurior]|uniref:Secreted protein n=1 Tax=Cardiocondyla obscurior TaxID=286306 RepID=A0AAW2F2P7_9HYME